MIHINQEQLYKSIAELQRLFLSGEEKQLIYEKFIAQLNSFIPCQFLFLGRILDTQSAHPKFEHWVSTVDKNNEYSVSRCSVSNANLDVNNVAFIEHNPPVTLRQLKTDHPPIHSLHSIPLIYKNTSQGLLGIINKEDQYSEATVLELSSLFDTLASLIYHFENSPPLHATQRINNKNATQEKPKGAPINTSDADCTPAKSSSDQSQRTLQSLLNLGLTGIVLINIEGIFIEVNDIFCDLVGFKKEQLINHSWIEITHPADRDSDQYFFERVNTSNGLHHTTEKRFLRADKKSVSVLMTANRVQNEHGKTVQFAVILQDVTNKNQELEKFRLVFEQSSDPHFICDTDKIIDCNQAAIEILGCGSKEETLKIHPKNISPPTQEETLTEIDQSPMTYHGRHNGIHRFDWIYQNTKGKLISIEIMLNPVYIGNKPALLIVWHDNTAIKETKELLTNAKKIALEAVKSKNKYLVSLSCQLRTHLNSIYFLNESLVDSLTGGIPEIDHLKLKTIQCSASRLIALVDQIDQDAKHDESPKEVFDISNTVQELCTQINPDAQPELLQLKPSDNDSENLNVYGKKNIIKQVILDILNTSIKDGSQGTVIVSLQKLVDKKIGQAVKVSICKEGQANALNPSESTPDTRSVAKQIQLERASTLDLVSKLGGRMDNDGGKSSNNVDLLFPIFLENNQPSPPSS
ncbi:MAG: hypothetical protein COB04_07610 [Gammaproteobacteria bacterium]|nr:MAG: hypothetical protein COB04_07610 [Gammaproteobacteria bacterium]